MQVQNNWMTLINHYFPSEVGHGEITQPLASLRVYAHKGQVMTPQKSSMPGCSASFSKQSQKAALKSEAQPRSTCQHAGEELAARHQDDQTERMGVAKLQWCLRTSDYNVYTPFPCPGSKGCRDNSKCMHWKELSDRNHLDSSWNGISLTHCSHQKANISLC